MANQKSYLEFLEEQLAPLGEITSRAMFGGHVLYCDGTVFALVASNALYLKVDDQNRVEFEGRGLNAFKPFDGPGVMQYYEAPPEIFEDPAALQHWGAGSVAAGRRAKAKKKPARRKRA